MANRLETAARDLDPTAGIVSVLLAIPPSLALYFVAFFALIGSASADAIIWGIIISLLGGPVVFGWLLYGQPTHRQRVSAMFFYVAILAFAFPLAAFVGFALLNSSAGGGAFGLASGVVVMVLTGIVTWTVGLVCYLLSKRLRRDSSDGAAAG